MPHGWNLTAADLPRISYLSVSSRHRPQSVYRIKFLTTTQGHRYLLTENSFISGYGVVLYELRTNYDDVNKGQHHRGLEKYFNHILPPYSTNFTVPCSVPHFSRVLFQNLEVLSQDLLQHHPPCLEFSSSQVPQRVSGITSFKKCWIAAIMQ